MVRNTKQTRFKESDLIKASEIGQYFYCSVSWYLQKYGYKPQSPLLEIGINKHVKLGDIIDYTETGKKKSRILASFGYLLLIVSVLIVIFEVII